jgi:hypothetical protein
VAKRSAPSHQINPAQRRMVLTSAYLKVICPGIDQKNRTKLADSILALIEGEDHWLPQRKITAAQVVEMVWRQSQCILNQTGKCPLLIFGEQLAKEVNEFFTGDE